MQELLSSLTERLRGSRRDDSATWVTTPWGWRDADGVYYRSDGGEAWVYRTLPVHSLVWEDDATVLQLSAPLHHLLNELGAATAGSKWSRNLREIHLVSVTWERDARPPETTPPGLKWYFEQAVNMAVPVRTVFFGVRLRPASAEQHQRQTGVRGVIEAGEDLFARALGDVGPDRSRFRDDLVEVDATLHRAGARKPTDEEMAQLESWYNLGRGPDAVMYEHRTHIDVDHTDRIEIAAAMRFRKEEFTAPSDMWVADAQERPDAPHVISVRAFVEPNEQALRRVRQARRKARAGSEEELRTGDVSDDRYVQAEVSAEMFEEHLRDTEEPVLQRASILAASRQYNLDYSWVDHLRSRHGIEWKPLEHRQIPALEETLPVSRTRVNPFVQDLDTRMLAYAGLQQFGALGDEWGLIAGLVDPDATLCLLDPTAARRHNRPASMLIAGDSGSGKTFLLQLLMLQAHLAGYPAVLINPKAHDNLSGLVELARTYGRGGRRIALSELEQQPGALDPFGYADPSDAADIASNHIISVFSTSGKSLTNAQEVALQSGLQRAAREGARSVGEALAEVRDKDVVSMVHDQCEDRLFSLGVAFEPVPQRNAADELTLIEFDRQISLPTSGKSEGEYTRTEAIAVGALRLAIRSSLYTLMRSGYGGVFGVDEGWAFLKQSAAYEDLERVGREGRSQGILPIIATQRIADVTQDGKTLAGHFSRVMALQMQQADDAAVALETCYLEPTPERVAWLNQCGPRSDEEGNPVRWASGLHRDVHGRRAGIAVGPWPRHLFEYVRTNQDPADDDT